MLKKLLVAAGLLFMSVAVKADENPKIDSKVQKVIVFLNGAQVTRTATANIPAGTSTLVFNNISPDINVQSLQVHADGDFTILSVKNELNFLNGPTKQKEVEELQLQQKALTGKISFQYSIIHINNQEEEMLTKNQVVTGQNVSLDIVKLKQALDFQTARLTDIKKRQAIANEQVTSLNEESQKISRQIAEITRGNSKTTGNILVTISSKTALTSAFTLSYLVNNASWYPTYDIRAKNVNKPITIAYKANVTQHTGEDWKNIKLTLSTGNPSISGSKPDLNPYYLNFGMNYPNAVPLTKISGRVYDSQGNQALPGVTIKVKGTSIATTSDVYGNYSIQIPAAPNQMLEFSYIGYEYAEQYANRQIINMGLRAQNQALNEVAVVGYGVQKRVSVSGMVDKISAPMATIPVAVKSAETPTNVEFNIDNPYSIPNDGKQYLVEINQIEIPANYQYYTAPKISTDVFLTASLTDWNKYNLLSGEANLFFEGTYIGKSLIDIEAITDTLNLSLGADKNIVVTRTLQKELTEKQTFGANKKDTRDWLINIKNRKNQTINLLVDDQVPVSQNSSIEVDTQNLSGGNMDKTTGKVSWNLTLNSQGEKKLGLKYQVKYPKNQNIIVQ